MNRIEELAELDHGVELRLRVPAVGVVKEQKPLDVGLHGIEPNLLGDVFTKGSPGPFDGVRVHVRIVRVDEVVRMVDRFVCVVEAHLTQFVVPAPAVAVDDRTALNVVGNGFGQRVRTVLGKLAHDILAPNVIFVRSSSFSFIFVECIPLFCSMPHRSFIQNSSLRECCVER